MLKNASAVGHEAHQKEWDGKVAEWESKKNAGQNGDDSRTRRVAPRARMGPLTVLSGQKKAELEIKETLNFWRPDAWKAHFKSEMPQKKMQPLRRKGQVHWGVYRAQDLDPFPPPPGVWQVSEIDKESAVQTVEVDRSDEAQRDDQPETAWRLAQASMGLTKKDESHEDTEGAYIDIVKVTPNKCELLEDEDDDWAAFSGLQRVLRAKDKKEAGAASASGAGENTENRHAAETAGADTPSSQPQATAFWGTGVWGISHMPLLK